MHASQRLDFHHRGRVVESLLPLFPAGAERARKEEAYEFCEEVAFLRVPQRQGLRHQWLRRKEQGYGRLRGLRRVQLRVETDKGVEHSEVRLRGDRL